MILYQLYTIMWIVYGLIPPPSRSKNQALSPPTPQKPKVTLSPCRGLCYCQGLDLHSYTLWVGMENAELESSNPPRISKKMGGLASGEDGISPIPCGSGLENGPNVGMSNGVSECMLDRYSRTLQDAHQIA